MTVHAFHRALHQEQEIALRMEHWRDRKVLLSRISELKAELKILRWMSGFLVVIVMVLIAILEMSQ